MFFYIYCYLYDYLIWFILPFLYQALLRVNATFVSSNVAVSSCWSAVYGISDAWCRVFLWPSSTFIVVSRKKPSPCLTWGLAYHMGHVSYLRVGISYGVGQYSLFPTPATLFFLAWLGSQRYSFLLDFTSHAFLCPVLYHPISIEPIGRWLDSDHWEVHNTYAQHSHPN